MAPAAQADIVETDDLFRAEPFIIWFRVLSDEIVRLSRPAEAGATTLYISPLTKALSTGHRVFFQSPGFSVKLTGNAPVGSTTLTISALAGPLAASIYGKRQLDAAALSLSWTLEKKQPQATTVLLTKTPTTTTDPQDPDPSPFSLAVVTKSAAELATAPPGVYVQRLVRTDTGRALAQGDVVLKVR